MFNSTNCKIKSFFRFHFLKLRMVQVSVSYIVQSMALRAASNRARKLVPADRKAFLDGVAACAGTQWRSSRTNNCSSHKTNASENSRIPSHCNAGISKIPSLTSFLSAVLETHQRNRCAKLVMIRDVVGVSVFWFFKDGDEESQSEIGYQVVAG